jgi:hypothetical protein
MRLKFQTGTTTHMSFTQKVKKLADLPSWLNWLLSVVEPVIVLVFTYLVIYSSCLLIFGDRKNDQNVRMIELLKLMSENWKVALILIILLFYRTVRIFLEQAEEAWGVKRKKPIFGEPQQLANPVTGEAPGLADPQD